jgi:hypothetical protein
MLVIGPAERTPLGHPEFFFSGVCVCVWGLYKNLCSFLKTVLWEIVKILKLTSSYVSGRIKTEKEEKVYIFVTLSYVSQYSSVPVICRFQWLILADA